MSAFFQRNQALVGNYDLNESQGILIIPFKMNKIAPKLNLSAIVEAW